MGEKKADNSHGQPNKEKANKGSNPSDSSEVTINDGHKEGVEKPKNPNKEKERGNSYPRSLIKNIFKNWGTSDKIQAAGLAVNFFLVLITIGALCNSQNALRETKKSFKEQNRPYLQASGFRVFLDTLGRPVSRYIVSNLGLYPAKIKTIIHGTFWDTAIAEQPFKETNIKLDTNEMNIYVIKDMPTDSFMVVGNKSLREEEFKATVRGDLILYMYAEIRYFNELEKTDNLYKVKVRFYPPEMMNYSIMTNDNEVIK